MVAVGLCQAYGIAQQMMETDDETSNRPSRNCQKDFLGYSMFHEEWQIDLVGMGLQPVSPKGSHSDPREAEIRSFTCAPIHFTTAFLQAKHTDKLRCALISTS